MTFYDILNEIYWKSFWEKGFWVFSALCVFITQVIYAFVLPESKAYILGADFSLSYFIWFFGPFLVFFYPLVWYISSKRRG